MGGLDTGTAYLRVAMDANEIGKIICNHKFKKGSVLCSLLYPQHSSWHTAGSQ